MKTIFFILLLCGSLLGSAQVTPSKVVRVPTAATTFGENIPRGTIITDASAGKTYSTILGIASTKSLATCTLDTDYVELTNSGSSTLPVTNDVESGAAVYPVWTTGSGDVSLNISNSKMIFIPSIGDFYIAGALHFMGANPQIVLGATMDFGLSGQVLTSGGAGGPLSWTSVGGGSMGYPSSGIAVSTGTGWGTSLTDNHANWDKYNQWDGGSTGLTASTGRASLGLNYSVQTLSGTTVTWNVTSGTNAKLTLSGATTITLSNITAGQTGTIVVTNPASTYSLSFAGYTNKISPSVYVSANTVITSGNSKIDCYSWFYDGTYLMWNGSLNYR